MSEHADEIGELRASLAQLNAAFDELRQANTAREREEAHEDVAEAKADLDAIARSAGVSRSAIDKAIADARKAERREELRPILQELLDELADEDETEEASTNGDKPKDEKPEPAPPKPPRRADTEPTVPHWSERPVRELLR